MADDGRILTLDAVRGVAVLGILAMNIVDFAMPEPAYANPAAWGGATGANLAVYLAMFVLVDGKMRGLFSFLFGASALLVMERAEAGGRSPARVHLARMAWLFVFGIAHLFLVWRGDILQHYALVGLLLPAWRRTPTERLLVAGVLLLGVALWLAGGAAAGVAATGAAMHVAHPAAATVRQWAEDQHHYGTHATAAMMREVATYRGGYAGILADRLRHQADTPLQTLAGVGPETLAYFLFGMAAFRSGFLTGGWARARYRCWAAWGLGLGAAGYAALGAMLVAAHFSAPAVALGVVALPVLLRPVMIAGWIAAVALTLRPGGWWTVRLAAAGRMAFSNYLATSVICTSLFYGYGAGLFGRLERWQLYPIVLVIWAAMLAWSQPWLARFRYGPLEWLWRSLARAEWQPMRLARSCG